MYFENKKIIKNTIKLENIKNNNNNIQYYKEKLNNNNKNLSIMKNNYYLKKNNENLTSKEKNKISFITYSTKFLPKISNTIKISKNSKIKIPWKSSTKINQNYLYKSMNNYYINNYSSLDNNDSKNNENKENKNKLKFRNEINNNKFLYIIRPENCGYLLKKCFENRINWEEVKDLNYEFFNFKWQQNNWKINFSNLSKISNIKQLINHFEFNCTITNKANLFINLLKYAEQKNINIFQYIPFTILFDYESENFLNSLEKFENLFNNIENYIVDYKIINNYQFRILKGRLYKDFFPFDFEDKIGSKTAINIPNSHYDKNQKGKNLWLIKAPDLNRGRCIELLNNFSNIKKFIKLFYEGILNGYFNSNDINNILDNHKNKKYKSNLVVVQKYIENPLLYFGRKFDIRIWVLLSYDLKVYVFKEGHLKTCSNKYDVNSNDIFSHLTNYSLQKHNKNFSQYEKGNELSFDDLQYNIDINYSEKKINFKIDILPKIYKIIEFTFRAVSNKINSFNRKFCFEIFGFDFMIDNFFNPFLIEVNMNPGLEESSPLIKILIPRMLDDALRLTVDKLFEPKYKKNNIYSYNEKNNEYKSSFPVNGYLNSENLFDFVCDLNIDENNNKKKIINNKKFKIIKKNTFSYYK